MPFALGTPMKSLLFLLCLLWLHPAHAQDRVLWRSARASVTFVSDAPLERITATNTGATGILDPQAHSFAVQIPVTEFEGFNSPLQREHFNENYLLSRQHPKASFTGRIIEAVDLRVPGEHVVRAKGTFTVKGVARERIIPCRLIISRDGVRVMSDFDVLLDEHGIRVPRVVQQKISSVVKVSVDLLFLVPATAP
jgi:hypothetical protein